MLPDEVVVVAVTELSVVVISPVVDDSVTPDNTVITSRSIAQSIALPDVVLVGSAVPDPEQASWSLSDKLAMLG